MVERISRRAFVSGSLAIGGLTVGSAMGWAPVADAGGPVTVTSPDGAVAFRFRVRDGRPQYRVERASTTAISWSHMGFQLTDGETIGEGMRLVGQHEDELDETWRPVWGAQDEVREHCKRIQLRLAQAEESKPYLGIEARVFNDGVGFRYLFDERFGELGIAHELTEFGFTADHTAWSIPANYDNYEYLFTETPLTEAGYLAAWQESRPDAERLGAMATPLTVQIADDLYLAVHEAALYDYPEMTLSKIDGGPSLRCELAPRKSGGGQRADIRAPFNTPWRTCILGDSPGKLVESHLVLNLNEPCVLEDTSWIKPGKYLGVWWEIHKGQSTWARGPHVGATTENAMRYIDFAAENDIPYLLVEGWNVGWKQDDFGNSQDFLTPIPEFDLPRVVEYGKNRGVQFLAHNESGGGVHNYESQIDAAFAKYAELGLPGVKTGYAGQIDQYFHHEQWMVNHYQRVIEKAAKHRLMINAHEPIKPTGIERTYPNFVSREGVRGQEFEAWSKGNPAEHTVTIPFTRMLAGPVDYTPGIFNITWSPPQAPDDSMGPDNDHTRLHTTRAHQVALFPVLLSGVQMLADIPEHYRGAPELEFLRNVPVSWDETRVINGAIGDYISMARRSGHEWFIGSLTDEQSRNLDIPLDFLGDAIYLARFYTDAPDTDVDKNPNAMSVRRFLVTRQTVVRAELSRASGHAIHILPATNHDRGEHQTYPG